MIRSQVRFMAVSKRSTGCNLATMNPSRLGVDDIQTTTDNWCAFAMDTDGTLYGIVKEVSGSGSSAVTTSRSLYKINKLTEPRHLSSRPVVCLITFRLLVSTAVQTVCFGL